MMPVMTLLPLLLVRLAIRKPIDWKMGYLVSFAGVASHLALDWTNVYGIRLFLPFSAQWLRLDITSVIDAWIWVALLLAVIAPALSRLVGEEIGVKRRSYGRVAAILALSFLLAYNGARAIIHQRALAILDSRIYAGSPPRRVAAFPNVFHPLQWRGLVAGQSFYVLFNLNPEEEFDPTAGTFFYQSQESDAIRAAAGTEAFQGFLTFAQYPLWTTTPISDPPGGVRVELLDMRFGTPSQPGFVATAILDAKRRIVRSWFAFLRVTPR